MPPSCPWTSGINCIAERVRFLGEVLKGTRPQRKEWLARIEKGQREGRFDALVGEIDEVQPGPAGLRVHVSSRHGQDVGGTGGRRGQEQVAEEEAHTGAEQGGLGQAEWVIR